MPSEKNTRDVARKSIVTARFIPEGTILTEDMIKTKRPGTGIPPTEIQYVVGRKIVRDVQEDQLLGWEVLG